MRDITCIRQIVEDTEICLDQNDAISIRLWSTQLQQDGAHVILKDKQDPPPLGSALSPEIFVLCIQTKFQCDRFQELGSDFVSIDATHNTTQYVGLQLFTIIVRDLWGHGACCGVFPLMDTALTLHFHFTGGPVAWMLSLDGTQATIQFFLEFVKSRHPQIVPTIIMTDRDQAQMNAITAIYPGATMLLCWWHVLRTIQMHFHTEEFPQLWERIRQWVKLSDQSKFDLWWKEMQADPSVPQSVVDYLRKNWMGIVPLWSGTSRQHWTIFQEGDTNMLIEA